MNLMQIGNLLLLSFVILCYPGAGYARPLAFPSAEGGGKYTIGGRGGHLYEVTNLNDAGPGSLREAIDSPAPRMIVFRVSGTIELKSFLHVKSYTTIAGQTAPGDGITLRGWSLNFAGTQIILRYLRSRLGNDGGAMENDAIHGSGGGSNFILDHLSASWSVDEALSIYGSDSVTIQWCMSTESLNNSFHKEGDHGYGGLWGGNWNSHHHNLFAHHLSRTPRFKGNSDFRNNVIYNWAENSAYGGGENNGLEFNLVANYYKPGPATKEGELKYRIVNPYGGGWYITDNYVFGNPGVTADNWNGGVQKSRGTRANTPFSCEPVNQQTAEKAFSLVLEKAGCTFPKRDPLDERIVQEVRDGKAAYGNNGLIDTPDDVGGWPKLNSTTPPADGDHDGMPDDWEKTIGLNPEDPSDGPEIAANGYSNVENYVNSLVDDFDITSIKKEQHLSVKEFSSRIITSSRLAPKIELFLPAETEIKLELFDTHGKSIAVLVDEVRASGRYMVDVASIGLACGFYLYKCSTPYSSHTDGLSITR